MTDERHGLPSASIFDRRVFCPGSEIAEQAAVEGLPEDQSDIAAQGDAIHAAVAEDDMSELGLTAEKIAHKLSAMNEQALLQWCHENNFSGVKTVIKEERSWIVNRAQKRMASAKPDFVAIESSQALIIDNKTGFKRVTAASGNWQLKVQLVAIDQNYGPLERARVAIAQHRLGSVFDSCDYTRDDIDQAYMEVMFYCNRSRQPNMERVPGDHCRYCTAKAVCQEYAGFSMLPMVRAQLLGPMAKKDIYAKVMQLPPDALAFIESRRTAGTNLFEAVKERMKTLPEDVLKELGYCLKPGGHTRIIPNLAMLWKILEQNQLCSAEEFRAMCDISFGRMEDLIVTRIKLKHECSTEDAEKSLDSLIEPVVVKTDKAKRLERIKPC